MYKVILVDDEKLTIKAFAKSVDWEKCGFELSGVFFNGFDCIEYVENNSVDLIICDISMPQMDGLEVAKIVNKLRPDVKIILSSAYKKFDYAVEAVKLKVFDYIVKPFDCETIEDMLKKVQEELIKSSSEGKNVFLNSDDNMKIQKRISDFLEKRDNSFMDTPMMVGSVDLRNVPVIIINVSINDLENYLEKIWKYGIDGIYNAINNLLSSEHCIIYPLKYSFDNISFIFFGENQDYGKLIESFERIRNNVEAKSFEYLNLSISVDVVRSGSCIEDVVYNEMDVTLDIQVKMLISVIKDGSISEIDENINRFYEVFRGNDNVIRSYCFSVINGLINTYDIDEIRNVRSDFGDIFTIEDIEVLKQEVLKLCKLMLPETDNNAVYNSIAKAKKYVRDNIGSNITLASVSEYVSFSPSYFGRVFKEKTNEKFLDFVNRIRIEQSCRYLETTGMKVNEIYERVGYKSRNYFYNMFKSLVGCTPLEYREKMHKNEN